MEQPRPSQEAGPSDSEPQQPENIIIKWPEDENQRRSLELKLDEYNDRGKSYRAVLDDPDSSLEDKAEAKRLLKDVTYKFTLLHGLQGRGTLDRNKILGYMKEVMKDQFNLDTFWNAFYVIEEYVREGGPREGELEGGTGLKDFYEPKDESAPEPSKMPEQVTYNELTQRAEKEFIRRFEPKEKFVECYVMDNLESYVAGRKDRIIKNMLSDYMHKAGVKEKYHGDIGHEIKFPERGVGQAEEAYQDIILKTFELAVLKSALEKGFTDENIFFGLQTEGYDPLSAKIKKTPIIGTKKIVINPTRSEGKVLKIPIEDAAYRLAKFGGDFLENVRKYMGEAAAGIWDRERKNFISKFVDDELEEPEKLSVAA